MACEKDELLIAEEDFDCIAELATSCDIDRLCPYITEKQDTDLLDLLGPGLFADVLANKDNPDYQDLLCGSQYDVTCGTSTKKRKHFGLKRVLVHLSYGEYALYSGMVPTPFSFERAQSPDSIPVSNEELTALRRKHIRIARKFWTLTHQYLCDYAEDFEEFDDCDCKKCNCKEDCNCSNDTIMSDFSDYEVVTIKKNSINGTY